MSIQRAHDHTNRNEHEHEHDHSHGLVARSILGSRAGVKAVALSLLVLLLTTAAQFAVFLFTNSVALLADLIHNFGDALTAVPLGIAFWLRSMIAEKRAGYFVVAMIFVSAAITFAESLNRLVHPHHPAHMIPLAAAGIIGFAGNEIAGLIRTRAGRRLNSAALLADAAHARTDGLVSLSVVASAIVTALGFPLGDPLIGLTLTVVILRITWHSLVTIRNQSAGEPDHRHAPARTNH